MNLSYHDDWPDARRHIEAWWANDAIDRAAMAVVAPRQSALPGPPQPAAPDSVTERWLNAEYRAAAADYQLRQVFFSGEALPLFWPNLGPGIAAAYLGVEPVLDHSTVWFTRGARDWPDLRPTFDPHNRWWQATLNLIRVAAQVGDGKFFVAITDLGGVTDIEASLRGTMQLLTDLAEAAAEVKRVRDRIVPLWCRWYEEQERVIHQRFQGTSSWLGAWSPGRTYTIQCDFSCMISPKHFEEFVAPELEALCSWLDQTLYHLDGPDAVKHLDRLLAMPRLNGIQWTPGAGAPSAVHWLPMLKKIQKAGKLLHLHEHISNVETLLRELSPRGLMVQVVDCPNEADARDLLRKARDWCRSG